MIHRYSSLQLSRRGSSLLESFLNVKLRDAVSYDRIAGYFSLSILEIAGEYLSHIPKVRMICNSHISLQTYGKSRSIDNFPASLPSNQFKESLWREFNEADLIGKEVPKDRLEALYLLLASGRLEVKILPEERFGLIHGKAGVLTFRDGSNTSFIGSANESVNGWKLNYELVWEDSSESAVEWVQKEFNDLWGDSYAFPLTREIIEEINRISKREIITVKEWKQKQSPDPSPAIVETPVYRKQNGLWSHQKYFVQKVFEDHKKFGGARYLLADQVGLGKTLQLAMCAQLIGLLGTKPILIIAPKTLLFQWQGELLNLLDVPSAVWNGKLWIDENGVQHENRGAGGIKNCPRKIGLISQGLITRGSAVVRYLLQNEYDCVILDEAHRARRSDIPRAEDRDYSLPNDSNQLFSFMREIARKTKTLLLASATPVQMHPVEAWDLLFLLNVNYGRVLGDDFSEWNRPVNAIQSVMEPESLNLNVEEFWNWTRNPLPPANETTRDGLREFESIRDSLNLQPSKFIASQNDLNQLFPGDRDRLEDLRRTFFKDHNPFIRHIIQRTRKYLEETIDATTGKPLLDKVEVLLFGENDSEALELGSYQKDAYDKSIEYCALIARQQRGRGFLETFLLRRIGSSMKAGYNTSFKFLHGDSSVDVDPEIEEEDVETIPPALGEEEVLLRQIISSLEINQSQDPKLEMIYKILTEGLRNTEPWMERGCILFSCYYDTALWIAEELSKRIPEETIGLYAGGMKSARLKDGKMNRVDREEIKRMVKDRRIKILIGTDAASEGLNLQTLGSLINIDLPWNPTRLEQRKGRIQRIGQTHNTIYIYNMRYKDSVEDNVHRKLSERLENVRTLFGQIPDTLEDVWVSEALDSEQEIEKQIKRAESLHPFEVKYNQNAITTDTAWESCFEVMNEKERRELLLGGWG